MTERSTCLLGGNPLWWTYLDGELHDFCSIVIEVLLNTFEREVDCVHRVALCLLAGLVTSADDVQRWHPESPVLRLVIPGIFNSQPHHVFSLHHPAKLCKRIPEVPRQFHKFRSTKVCSVVEGEDALSVSFRKDPV
jgi:hypothetical protein